MDNLPPSKLCTYCNSIKPHIFANKKLKDGSKIYINSSGQRWAGRRCPDCERLRVQSAKKCAAFEKEIIISHLEKAGFEVQSRSLPLKALKEGQTYQIGILHAKTEKGAVKVDQKKSKAADLYALVFPSIRLASAEQVAHLSTEEIG